MSSSPASTSVRQATSSGPAGLHDSFLSRVIDTPIAETAIVGSAVGAAVGWEAPGGRFMYTDILRVCFDEFLNHAAKLHFMTEVALAFR